MKRKLKRSIYWITPTLIVTFSWLLWPFESEKFAISFDEDMIERKAAFLEKPIRKNAETQRPNVIIFMADDLAQTDISLYGSTLINTPNIDAIGKNGVTFTDGYVTSPICSPSRAGLLTGRYQQRFGYEFQPHDIYLKNRLQYYGFTTFVNSDPWSPVPMTEVPRIEDRKMQGLPPSEITLAELLKKYDYQTAFIGKWHLGAADFALPCNRGFDYSYGFYYSHSLFGPEDAEWIVNRHVPEDWTDEFIWKSSRVGESQIYRNCEVIEEPEYLTQRIAEETVDFIEQHKDQPFFAYVPFSAPHTPLQAPKSYVEQFDHIEDPTKKVYHAMIASMDDAVGTVMNKLKELELEENTIVFFLSDNGGATYTMTTDNAPYRGGKITNFEGGIRVPFMVQWKGTIPENQQKNFPVSALDIFATAAGVAGTELPQDRIYDGNSLLPYVQQADSPALEQTLCWQMGNARAIRQNDWKLMIDDVFPDTLLFNMKTDPIEQNNLAPTSPKRVKELLTALNQWSAQMPEPLWPGMIYYTHEDELGSYKFED